MDLKVQNAIISVSDKRGLIEFSQVLHEGGVNIYSTGGTAAAIRDAGIPVRLISDYTGFPEILGGRVKSLHPKIHGGLLARRDQEDHMRQLSENGISTFDLVVINLYPFEETIKKEGTTLSEAVEKIDIGGPSMLRSAAKNYRWVCTVGDPDDYETIIRELSEKQSISLATRERMAMKVFERTAYYDAIISGYLQTVFGKGEKEYPGTINFYFNKRQDLRYGENPTQSACFYTDPEMKAPGVATAQKLWGKELSFNNILDIEAAFEIVKEFDEPCCSVIKHTNPCGTATASSLTQAFTDAWASDPVSAFGSIIGFNRRVDANTAQNVMDAGFIECTIAPDYEDEALEIIKRKKNVRILKTGSMSQDATDYDMKRVVGGVLVQGRDVVRIGMNDLTLATDKGADEPLIRALLFAWKVVKWVKSNAVVLAKGTKTVGIGAGQMSRVDSTFMAIHKANDRSKDSVLASDAFFPKPDAVELAIDAGVTAIIQPGGSIRDQDSIDVCNKRGVAMYFTGVRHFRH
jgi:phosphoribosylaminoimidazolecarboxamide formyltransferase/IMP cyclohydrolase